METANAAAAAMATTEQQQVPPTGVKGSSKSIMEPVGALANLFITRAYVGMKSFVDVIGHQDGKPAASGGRRPLPSHLLASAVAVISVVLILKLPFVYEDLHNSSGAAVTVVAKEKGERSNSNSNSSSSSNSNNSNRTNIIRELMDLVGTDRHQSNEQFCNETSRKVQVPLFTAKDRALLPELLPQLPLPLQQHRQLLQAEENSQGHRIPRIVHVTSKNRCLTKPFYDNVEQWKLANFSLFFHDDEAKNRLLSRRFPEFPFDLQMVTTCMKNRGATLADLWRYVLLYEYGGLYVDVDDGPGDLLLRDPAAALRLVDGNDAAFVEIKHRGGGQISQNFLAFSPGHPLMYLAVLECSRRLLELQDVGGQYIPYVTGPMALVSAWRQFLQLPWAADDDMKGRPPLTEGRHVGLNNRTVTVVAGRANAKDYIKTFALNGAKPEFYRVLGIQDYERNPRRNRKNSDGVTCFEKLHEAYAQAERPN